MISKKILYSEQLLQLVLALSLLQVDPVNYLEWGVSRIHDDAGSPWQLEIAQTTFSDYPYMNRKTYVPLIEDLVDYRLRNHDVQAYLLNLSNSTYPTLDAANEQIGVPSTQELNSTSDSVNVNNNFLNEGTESTLNLVDLVQNRFHELESDEIFLHSEVTSIENAESIAEQNLADLKDYEERNFSSTVGQSASHPDERDFLISQNSSQSFLLNRINAVLELNLNISTELNSSELIDLSEYDTLLSNAPAGDDILQAQKTHLRDNKKTEENQRSFESDGITSSVELTLEVRLFLLIVAITFFSLKKIFI